jgi:hypothetical protein
MTVLEKLRALSRGLSKTYLSRTEFPTKAYSGSIGDPYGHIRKNSDVDMEVWVTETEYHKKPDGEPVVDWIPHRWRWKTRVRPDVLVDKEKDIIIPADIDVVKLQNEEDASIYFLYVDKENFLNMPKILESNIEETNISDHYSPVNFGLRHFCETTLIEDSTNVFKSCENITRKTFEENRGKYTKDFLSRKGEGGRNLRFYLHKLEEDVKAVENGEGLDLTNYNKEATNVVNVLTYLACLVENVPRTYDSLFSKRKNNLWKALGMDQSKIFDTHISAKDGLVNAKEVKTSFETLKDLTKEIHEKAQKEFPDIKVFGVGFLRK